MNERKRGALKKVECLNKRAENVPFKGTFFNSFQQQKVKYEPCSWTLITQLRFKMVVVLTHLWMVPSLNRNADCPPQQLVPVGL